MRALGTAIGLAALAAPAEARAEDKLLPQPALVVAADAGMGSRRLTYKDDLFGALRPYHLPAAPAVGAEITIFPAALFTNGKSAWIGLHVRYEAMPGIDSRRSGHDAALPTEAWAGSAALRFRRPFPFGALWVDLGGATRTFAIEAAEGIEPDVPSVRYAGLTFGIGAEFALPFGLTMAPRAGGNGWSALGDIRSDAWFPHARALGVDFGLRVSAAWAHGFAPYLDIAWSRDILFLEPEPGDARVAGGAADDTVTARVGLSWTLAGKPQVFR